MGGGGLPILRVAPIRNLTCVGFFTLRSDILEEM